MKSLLLAVLLATAAPEATPAPEPVEEVVVDISGPIGSTMVAKVKEALAKPSKRLKLVIDSGGGEIGEGLDLIQVVVQDGRPTTCVVMDYAASMAAVLLESPACGKRVLQAHSVVMFHEALQMSMGSVSAHQARTMANALRAWTRVLSVLVSGRLGISIEDFEQRIRGTEWWMVGKEALEANAADEVLPVPKPAT